MKVVDWLARTVMLVLASLATLALIGSLASVSDSTMSGAFPGRIDQPDDRAPAPQTTPASGPESTLTEASTPPETPIRSTPRAAPRQPSGSSDIARWLKALTYAVLALTGFVAVGVVALARVAGHLDRATLR